MSLDPKARALLTAIAAAGEPSVMDLPLDAARRMVEEGYDRMKIPLAPVASMTDVAIPGPGGEIPLRIYRPEGEGPFPVVLFIHGGGWVFYRLNQYDAICTRLCRESQALVVSVDYRRAPDVKFPGATDECLEAARCVAEQCREWGGDPYRLFLCGDSSGGNLAAVTALRLRDEGGPGVRGQVLIYPVTDYYLPEKPSYAEFAEGYNITRELMAWFWEQYLPSPEEASNPHAAPLQAADLSGLPPALLVVAGCDVLRDEAIDYARRLREAGGEAKVALYEGMIHGFLTFIGILPDSEKAIRQAGEWIKARS